MCGESLPCLRFVTIELESVLAQAASVEGCLMPSLMSALTACVLFKGFASTTQACTFSSLSKAAPCEEADGAPSAELGSVTNSVECLILFVLCLSSPALLE